MKFFLVFLLVAIVSAEAISTNYIEKLRNNPSIKYSESLLDCIRANQSEASQEAQNLLIFLKEYDDLVESANARIDECIAIPNPIVSASCLLELSVVVSNEAQVAVVNVIDALLLLLGKEGTIAKQCYLS